MAELLPEIADVRLVDAIATTGSIGSAAASLRVSQPSASQRLAFLERRLGVRLVERDTRGALLTPAGDAFLERARRALALLDEAVVSAQSPLGQVLSVGTIGSLAPAVFAALLTVLPDVQVREVTNHGAVLARAVADGALDACVIGLDPRPLPRQAPYAPGSASTRSCWCSRREPGSAADPVASRARRWVWRRTPPTVRGWPSD